MLASIASLSSVLSSFSQVSICGSRHGSDAASLFVPSLRSFSFSGVRVGCARGVDSLVRSVFPAAAVFRAGIGRGALPARTARLVQAGGSAGALLVAFPSDSWPPSGCIVGRSFRGGGSGSWGAVALALGLGFPVLVWCPSLIASPDAPLPGLSRLWASPPGFPVAGSFWFSAGSASTPVAAPTLF